MALLHQASCDGWQVRRLGRVSHDAHRRLRWITAQDGDETSVGTETVGIETSKQDTLLCDGVQFDSHILLCTHGWEQVAGKALHDDNQDVGIAIGSLRLQYWIGVGIARVHHCREECVGIFFRHETVLLGEVLHVRP